MTEAYPTRRALRELNRRPSRRAWVLRWILIGVAAALLLLVGWVGVRGLIAKAELAAALPLVSDLKDDLKSFDLTAAQGTVATVAAKTESARAMTSDPVWRLFETIPLAGPNFTAFRELARITDDIADRVMVPAASLADTLDPANIKPVDGRIDVSAFEDAVPVVNGMAVALTDSYDELSELNTSAAIGPIRDAHAQMTRMLTPLLPLMDQADGLVTALPGMLGADGSRHYLLVFLNNAEARALGGHAGSWVQIDVDNGDIELVHQSPVQALRTGGVPVIELAPGLPTLWPGSGWDPANAAAIPDIELSAQTASAFWNYKFGVEPDAVFFMDPIALGRILESTGPIELPTGDTIDSDNAATFLLNGVYLKYPLNADQDAVFNSLSKSLFGAILGGDFDPKKLFEAVLESGDDHRVLAWSFNEAEQKALAALPLGVTRPTISDKVAQFGLYFADNLGSKMTYYVDAAVTIAQAQCTDGTAQYRMTVTMTNTVTPELGATLPNYVANRAGGNLRMLVTSYAPPGSQFIPELSTGWDPTWTAYLGSDGENAAMVQRIVLAPQQSVTATFAMRVPDGNLDRRLEPYVTPMARPVPVEQAEFTC